MADDVLDCFAVAAPGLEQLVAGELAALGLAGAAEPGGVPFRGTLADVARANLHLRIASRVLVRAARFHARALGELERRAKHVAWDRFLSAGADVRVRATSRKSRLYHQGAVAERVGTAIAERIGGSWHAGAEDEDALPPPLVVVRLLRDECELSVDTSGALLHRRGWRLAAGKAPLRETLAAALLAASGWDPATPLVDPFAGSGTIAIEAALRARRIAPGLGRRFAILDWPGFDPTIWDALVRDARERILPSAPPIVAADRDAGACAAARGNADRAGVAGNVEVRQAPLSALDPPPGRGALVSNPPYGRRLGDRRHLRDLYARLGQIARSRLDGWIVALLVPAAPLERETGLRLEERLRTTSGGLPVRCVTSAGRIDLPAPAATFPAREGE
jgi:putative N6-adenine-specific DNA methylase